MPPAAKDGLDVAAAAFQLIAQRLTVINFSKGARPGIYTFTAGRLSAVERGAEPLAEPKAAKPKKKKPAQAPT